MLIQEHPTEAEIRDSVASCLKRAQDKGESESQLRWIRTVYPQYLRSLRRGARPFKRNRYPPERYSPTLL